MPLEPGSDSETKSRNISEMRHAGHPQDQAVAAAMENARRHPRKKGRKHKKQHRRGKGRK
jgi:hypothetical protein